uniref:Uncharacterized protein n=1 Tax=Panagrolaimus sp. ES5 TaxID=591445 RepID=A0AC34EZF5_9BILA
MSDSIRYAAEYIAYFFYCDPFISGEEIERFTLELANSIINTINQNECCRKKLVQRTQPNSQRECCQRSDEFVMEINVDGRLASMIGDIAQSVMTLTPQEIADLLPDNTYVVISETYAFYSTNHGPCLFIFKSQSCKLIGISHRLKRNPIIRYSYDSHCFEINRKWLNKNSGYPKTNSSELIPRIQVVGSLETRHKNARKKNGHHSVMTPPKSAPPFLSRSSSFDIDENQEIGQKFLQMVKARLI